MRPRNPTLRPLNPSTLRPSSCAPPPNTKRYYGEFGVGGGTSPYCDKLADSPSEVRALADGMVDAGARGARRAARGPDAPVTPLQHLI